MQPWQKGRLVMNLLLKRGQADAITGKVTFKLWAKTELDDDERHIVKRYKFDSAKLIDIFQPNLVSKTISIGFILSIVIAASLSAMGSTYDVALFLGLCSGAVLAYFYYDRNRESVLVADLIHGRYFKCDSIVDIARKEAWIASVAAVFRQIMETAKRWDGTETIPIEALSKEEAKYIAIKSLF
jgi:hypothetical protein